MRRSLARRAISIADVGDGVARLSISGDGDFESTPYFNPVQKSFSMSNLGNSFLRIGPITVPEGFSVISYPSSLAPHASGTLIIQADADVDTDHTDAGNVSIVSNDASSPTLLAVTIDITTRNFQDNFSVDDANPIAAQADADTYGIWDTIDVENLMSVSGGKQNLPAQASAVAGDEFRLARPNRTNKYHVGRSDKALVALSTLNFSVRNVAFPVGWWPTAQSVLGSGPYLAIRPTSTFFSVTQEGFGAGDAVLISTATDYRVAVAYAPDGFTAFAKVGGVWHLLWVNPRVIANAQSGLSGFTGALTLEQFIIQAMALTNLVPSLSQSGTLSVGNLTNAPDGNITIEFGITVPSSGDNDFYFRKKDANNHWRLRVTSAGGVQLAEVVNGSATNRISLTGFVTGDTVKITARNQSISVWRQTAARTIGTSGNYTSSYTHIRELGLEVAALGTGGGFSNLIVWKAERLDVSGLGSERVTNGTFAADSNWSKGTGWTIAGGKANKVAGVASGLTQAGILTTGLYYELTYTVSNYVAGTLTPRFGNPATVQPVSANGTYTVSGIAAAADFAFIADAAFVGSVDDVSVKQITFAADALSADLDGLYA